MTRSTRTFSLSPRSFALLAGVAAITACQDDHIPVAPVVGGPLMAKTGAGKPSTAETVLFSGKAATGIDIFAMNPDGTNVRRLTTDTLVDVSPSFSPDNRKIVWVRNAENETWLLTANPDGTKETVLLSGGALIDNPRYSPDGTKIAFEMTAEDSTTTADDVNTDIFVINADGSGLTRITYHGAEDRQPAWSPDGKTIAFVSNRDGGYASIFTMTAGGLNVQPLVSCSPNCFEPEYSPDGRKLAFGSVLTGEIIVLDIAAKQTVGVGPTPPKGVSRHPTWTRDGTRVVFASDRGAEGTMELYVGTPGATDTESVRRLTLFSPGSARSPSFSH